MQPIKKVILKNFAGTSGEFELDKLTVISGGNASGKTTISNAIQFALLGYVPGCFINNSNPDKFEAWCTHEDGIMSVELHTEDHRFKVEYSKTKKGVSKNVTMNDAKMPSKSNGEDFLDIPFFDKDKFWGECTPSEKVKALFDIVKVDPEKVTELDKKIAESNELKRQAEKKKYEEEQALKNHQVLQQFLILNFLKIFFLVFYHSIET